MANSYSVSVGRRKESVARVRLFSGKGETIVNGKKINEYFPGEVAKKTYLKPFEVSKTQDKYFATVKVEGGGISSQLGAVVHGIARSLAKADATQYRKPLKIEGLLTRDPRAKERRKYGHAHKARAMKQSPKR
ncbi:30S ribosomal protein S9 [Candidatus Daviesbacteria bacterium]|nr:30S ribosomal protein S9 [Candidatus Daviesbacteria bacterium]